MEQWTHKHQDYFTGTRAITWSDHYDQYIYSGVQLSSSPKQEHISYIHLIVSRSTQPVLISRSTKLAENLVFHFIIIFVDSELYLIYNVKDPGPPPGEFLQYPYFVMLPPINTQHNDNQHNYDVIIVWHANYSFDKIMMLLACYVFWGFRHDFILKMWKLLFTILMGALNLLGLLSLNCLSWHLSEKPIKFYGYFTGTTSA